MEISKKRIVSRDRRANRIRKKVIGTSERPRLSVRRSLKHIYAQLIDDQKRITLVQVGSRGKEFSSRITDKTKMNKSAVSKAVGELLAEKAKEKGVDKIVFDRKGYLYHGRVKALAEAVRGKGLVF